MSKAAVPVIDISPWRGGDLAARRALAAEVDRTCREIGFMVISGHGVDPDLIAAVEGVSRTFFDLPLEESPPDALHGVDPDRIAAVEGASRTFFDLPLEDKRRIVGPAPDGTRGDMTRRADAPSRRR